MSEAVRVAVTGLARQEVIALLPEDIEASPLSDVEAATQLSSGAVNYVIGVCESGGGAALAMAIAIVGSGACVNLSKMGRPIDADGIPGLLEDGFRVFGIARDHLPRIVPALAECIKQREAPSQVTP